MRFLADGPFLPDELLVARDNGRVLFFCGAGVSRAKAELPGFLGLAERVLKELRALPDSAAGKLVNLAARLQKEPIQGVGGILAADRIFGLLERDFALADIERAVGRALRPRSSVDLQAHRTLLELSRSPDGQAQLVTTNFDLLFEAAAPKVPRWTPSQLPDLRRHHRFYGVVHLHGMFDNSYERPLGGNLVLSSAEFGRAYLADGWATAFIRAAIEHYTIVFVGYAADDPPVQYLLEALNRVAEQAPHGLYAFQEGRESEAQALWKQKGVRAIAYASDDNHVALWQTLSAWSERARNPQKWRDRLIRRALRGPEAMSPHERGQIVHLAATLDGARSLAEAKTPIPATWLCAFDPANRFETPGRANLFELGSPEIDPFTLYGIDSDPEPPKTKENQGYSRREIPANVIDVLAPLPLDGPATNTAGIRGNWSNAIAPLTVRLESIARWFMRVCGQPAALWWASGQKGLHPIALRAVEFELENRHSTLSPTARLAWRYFFDAWRRPWRTDIAGLYALKERLAREGWSLSARREFVGSLRPLLSVERPYGVKPPDRKTGIRLNHLVRLGVKYSEEQISIEIPDTELPSIVPLLRRNLEEAAALELEVNPFWLSHIPPIEPDPNLPGESSDRNFGINRLIFKFVTSFKRLVGVNCGAASRELAAWSQNDDPVFARLRIWAAGIPNLLDAEQAGRTLTTTPDRVFWGSRDQRDLLVVLARRWSDLSTPVRKKLEERLRRGLPRQRYHDRNEYPQRRAYSIVERLTWLRVQGCTFTFDVDAEITALRTAMPEEWMNAIGADATSSLEGRSGPGRTDTSFTTQLVNLPLKQLIKAALNAHDRRHGHLEERDPYAGLCEKRPVRVLAALMQGTEPDEQTKIAWTYFLYAGARRTDKPTLAALIARRLSQIPEAVLASIMLPASSWFEIVAKRLYETNEFGVWDLFDRLLGALAQNWEGSLPAKTTSRHERDWIGSAWGSVAGHLAAVLLADPTLNGVAVGTPLPLAWKARADNLRALPEDHGRFCLVQLARYLAWIFARDPGWAETTILSAIDSGGIERDAALAGFFSNARIDGLVLFNRIKSLLLALSVGEGQLSRRYEQMLSGLCISAWQQKDDAGNRWLSDGEIRKVLVYCSIDMRMHILWHVYQWSAVEEKLTLLKEVWPLQLTARSPAVTGRLCMIAFKEKDNFPALVDAILPLVSPGGGTSLMLPLAPDEESVIFERYPEHVLHLLSAVLPSDASKWPYGIDAALERLSKASGQIGKHPRMIELKARLARSRD
jgi:hypothetical protein